MTLMFKLVTDGDRLFSFSIPNNHNIMAKECGLDSLWNSDGKLLYEIYIELVEGIKKLMHNKEYYKLLCISDNTSYEWLLEFAIAVLGISNIFPDAVISTEIINYDI